MDAISLRRLGKCASDGLRPRAAKLSRQIRPLSNSRLPFRIVSRFQPSSRSARRWPPGPSSLTVRAMNNRRALPVSVVAVSINNALSESVNSMVEPPAQVSLERMIHHVGWFNFFESLSPESWFLIWGIFARKMCYQWRHAMSEPTYRRDLGGGLVLRWSTAADIEGLGLLYCCRACCACS